MINQGRIQEVMGTNEQVNDTTSSIRNVGHWIIQRLTIICTVTITSKIRRNQSRITTSNSTRHSNTTREDTRSTTSTTSTTSRVTKRAITKTSNTRISSTERTTSNTRSNSIKSTRDTRNTITTWQQDIILMDNTTTTLLDKSGFTKSKRSIPTIKSSIK